MERMFKGCLGARGEQQARLVKAFIAVVYFYVRPSLLLPTLICVERASAAPCFQLPEIHSNYNNIYLDEPNPKQFLRYLLPQRRRVDERRRKGSEDTTWSGNQDCLLRIKVNRIELDVPWRSETIVLQLNTSQPRRTPDQQVSRKHQSEDQSDSQLGVVINRSTMTISCSASSKEKVERTSTPGHSHGSSSPSQG
ncbi:hypothetical protein WN55_09496 [Dufourea novaeangliae]|uniref:Uncharacterized protein n=1 Tax=Dufourea novaeangliae TaxID=178035 RepID=A0A154NYJ8_DUFNO|nr:hypothetical protein WN55_09496 [Dufourea novaeangliae]